MNNTYNGNVYGVCSVCKRTIVVNPAYSYGYCPVCRKRYGTKYAIETYNRAMKRARHVQQVQQRVYNQNMTNSANYSEPEQEYSNDNVNTAVENKKLEDKTIIISAICVILIIILVAFFSSFTEKKNTQKRVAEKTRALSLHEGEIQMTEGYTDFLGKNYEDVEKRLKNYGFTNIKALNKNTDNKQDDNIIYRIVIDGNYNFDQGEWFSPDASVEIFYNKMAVVTTKVTTTQATTTAIITTVAATEPTAPPQPQGVTPEFKQMMDNYEAFFDEYISFMERLGNDSDSDDLAALGDYFSMLEKEARMLDEMEAIDEKELSAADDAYYIEVTARIYQKLMKVTFSLF